MSRKRTADSADSERLLTSLRQYVERGGNLNELARLAEMPPQTLHDWLTRGLPNSVVAFDRVRRLLGGRQGRRSA